MVKKLFLYLTGLKSTITFNSLNKRVFYYPVNNYELSLEFSVEKIKADLDVQAELNNATIMFKDELGNSITTTSQLLNGFPEFLLSGKTAFSGIITPPTLSSDQNNYNPANLVNCNKIRLTSTTDIIITGLDSTNIVDSQIIYIENLNITSTYKIILKDEGLNSLETNRFNTLQDIEIKPGSIIELAYNKKINRWLVVSEPSVNQDPVIYPASGLVISTGTTWGTSIAFPTPLGKFLKDDGTWDFAKGIPVGNNTELQYNNNGVFGASSGLTYDGTFLGVQSSTVEGIRVFDRHMDIHSNISSYFEFETYNDTLTNSNVISFYRGKGNFSAPTVLTAGTSIGELNYKGYNGNDSDYAVSVLVNATETWGIGAKGTEYLIKTIAKTTTTLSTRFHITDTGAIKFNDLYTFPLINSTGVQALFNDGTGVLNWGTVTTTGLDAGTVTGQTIYWDNTSNKYSPTSVVAIESIVNSNPTLTISKTLTDTQTSLINVTESTNTNSVKFGVLNVSGNNYTALWFNKATPALLNSSFYMDSGGHFYINADTGKYLELRVANSAVISTEGTKIGLFGTVAPTYTIGIHGNAAKSIGMERNILTDPGPYYGYNFSLYAGGAKSGITDMNGGNLILSSGISTGNGSSQISFYTVSGSTSGTTDQNPTEKMTILGNGNVGVGIANPSYKLDVSGGQVRFSTSLTILNGGVACTGSVGTTGTGSILFTSSATGKIGIGTSTPTNDLSFGGTVTRIIGLERNTTTTGKDLSLIAGGALASSTNLSGGNLILKSGIATGTGTANVQIHAPVQSAVSGTIDNSPQQLVTFSHNGANTIMEFNGSLGANIIRNGTSNQIIMASSIQYGILNGGYAYYWSNPGGIHPKLSLSGNAPTNDLEFLQYNTGTIIGPSRNTNDINAYSFIIQSGGAKSGVINRDGGELRLSAGIATGSGSSKVSIYTATAGVSGTIDATPTEKVTILGDGSVGIGTTTPAQKLDVNGTINATGFSISGITGFTGTGTFTNFTIVNGIITAAS